MSVSEDNCCTCGGAASWEMLSVYGFVDNSTGNDTPSGTLVSDVDILAAALIDNYWPFWDNPSAAPPGLGSCWSQAADGSTVTEAETNNWGWNEIATTAVQAVGTGGYILTEQLYGESGPVP